MMDIPCSPVSVIEDPIAEIHISKEETKRSGHFSALLDSNHKSSYLDKELGVDEQIPLENFQACQNGNAR